MEKYSADVDTLQRQELRQLYEQIRSYELDPELTKTAAAELEDLRARVEDLEQAIAAREAGV